MFVFVGDDSYQPGASMFCQTYGLDREPMFTFVDDDGNPVFVGYIRNWSTWADFQEAYDRLVGVPGYHLSPLSEFRTAYERWASTAGR